MDWKVETQKPGRLISKLLKPARHETGRVLVSEEMKRREGGRKGEVCVLLRVAGTVGTEATQAKDTALFLSHTVLEFK